MASSDLQGLAKLATVLIPNISSSENLGALGNVEEIEFDGLKSMYNISTQIQDNPLFLGFFSSSTAPMFRLINVYKLIAYIVNIYIYSKYIYI